MNEIWKPVVGFEGLYEVSNLGRVKSFPRNGSRVKHEIILKQKLSGVTSHKVYGIGLNKNDKRTFHTVHRLVAIAFIPNPENKPQVNHKDGNPLNNNLNNLEWVTARENMLHAFKTGLHSLKGDRHNNRKLDSKKANLIRYIADKYKGMTRKFIANEFGVSRATISNIINNKNWIIQ